MLLLKIWTRILRQAAFAKVNFDMGDNNNAMMIPTQAIIPQARDKKVIVYRSGMAILKR